MSRPRLGFNVDHIATVRQARLALWPDPVGIAAIAEVAGAEQITLHLREDRRHVQERDYALLRETKKGLLNLEMAATPAMLELVLKQPPDMVTLVPERRQELTTEGGLDVVAHQEALAKAVQMLRERDIVVSLFVDPRPEQLEASLKIGAQRVELHTGCYCNETHSQRRLKEQQRIHEAARHALQLGLGCAAGHGLDYANVAPIAAMVEVDELNIGHSIVARALYVGIERAIKDMLQCMLRPSDKP
ncbi:MAG: pyridoxine 5'-phosphate synthase [Proteobacteria bacterium]|nr:pyridoxine 5'-phosphate synthase [Cystobacterineae bacterium]MCL2258728.1 pyridoxine 5'-phosphate synthase [Cystobacterineae bacterium]MCL2314902.1 pyridoxine 5'-phosphate synthase [Pseudomonadota bacterium]